MNRKTKFGGIVAAALATVVGLGGTSIPAYATAGAFQNVTVAGALAASSRPVSVPSGTVAGETLLTNVTVTQSTLTGTSAPAGWTLACSQVGTNISIGVWWRTATASEPASYTWAVPNPSGVVAEMHRYSGLTVSPVDACAGQASSTAGTAVTVPALTVHGGDALAFNAIGWQNAGTATPPSGDTERADAKTSKDPLLLAVSAETSDSNAGACGAATCTVPATTATITQLSGEPTPQWADVRVALIPSAPPAPTNTAVPTVSGRTQIGQTLTATTGTWVGWPTLSYSYQWQDCTSTCVDISGATSSTYTLTSGDKLHRLKAKVTATSPGGASASAVSGTTRFIADLFDDFTGSNGIITNEYTYYNPGLGTHPSTDWAMNSGCLFRDSNEGGTRTPDTATGTAYDACTPKNNNDFFRMLSQKTFTGDTTVVVEKLRQNVDIHNYPACLPNNCYFGTHIWARYTSERRLYYFSVNRADGRIVIKKKVPCGNDNGGTYINLTLETGGYDWTVGVNKGYKVSVSNTVGGDVVLKLYDLTTSSSTPVLTATDPATGLVNPNWQAYCDRNVPGGDGVLDADAPADAFPTATSYPYTAPGQIGIRGDYSPESFDNITAVEGLI